MGGRGLLIVLAGFLAISGVVLLNISDVSADISNNIDRNYRRQTAQNIAQSGANRGLLELSKNRKWRGGFTLFDLLDGKCAVRVVDTTFAGRAVIAVISTGISNYSIKGMETISTSIAYVGAKFIPPFVRGALTTNNTIKVNGTFEIDGRDHTAAGVLVPTTGTYGIWTTGTFTQSGAATVGGTALNVDFAPSAAPNPAIIKQLQAGGGVPGTPDSLLGGPSNGFPEGTLKMMAQSGSKGSQYVTNPGLLTYPLRTLTYVELPSGGTWDGANVSGSGILIVHNGARNAIIRNTSGDFAGLIIADDVIHLQSDLLGAVISLTPAPSAGNVVGNATGWLRYSREVLQNATEEILTLGNGSGANVIAWKE